MLRNIQFFMDFEKVFKNSIIFKYGYFIFVLMVTIIFVNWTWRKLKRRNIPFQLYNVDGVLGYKEMDNESVGEDDIPALEEHEHILYNGATINLPGGAHQFYEMVQNRRSVRAFNPQHIPPLDIIKSCIRSAGTSPSGAHTEPWTFCVVEKKELKLRIREIVETEEELNYTQRMHRQWTTDLRPLKTNHIKPYLTEAPYLILIFKQVYGFTKHGKRKHHYYTEISASIATGILLCALQAAGLSALVTTPLNCGPSLRRLLNRPNNEKLLVLIPVGHSAEGCRIPDLQRKHLDEILITY